MNSSARFATLQIVGAALVLAAYLAGWLDAPFTGSAKYACIGISAVTLIGLALIAKGNRKDAKKIAQHVTALGLLGSVLGLYSAASGLTESNVWAVLGGAMLVWLSTAFGIIGWLWLELTLRLTQPRPAALEEPWLAASNEPWSPINVGTPWDVP